MKKKTNVVAIVTMFFLFAMVAFVTNMAAPFGNIWGYQYSWAGMMGNMMNFAAYLFMGIPAGRMLATVGYKKTSLTALGVGFVGLLVQYVSSRVGADVPVFTVQGQVVALNLIIYLLGAFISGHRTVINLICGAVVIVFGLGYLGVFKFNTRQKDRTLAQGGGFFRTFVFGIVFSLGWTPCVSAFLGSALMLAAQHGSTNVRVGSSMFGARAYPPKP